MQAIQLDADGTPGRLDAPRGAREPRDPRHPHPGPGAAVAPALDCADGVALGALLDASVRSLPAPDRKRRCDVSPHRADAWLRVDPDAVRCALVQVLLNACRHSSPDTPIRIGSRCDETDGGRYVVVTIADRGTGMRRADVQRAFDPQWRSDAAPRRADAGRGLTTARRLVEAQAGWIELRSALGVGTEVEVWLPG
jgi:signal transduction histidine kinase